MKTLIFACIIAAFCVTASLQDTPHSKCDDGPLPLSLNVHGCNSSPCNFYRGTDLIAEWDFAANADTQTLTPRVKVTVQGATINYPYPEKDACKALTNGKCPLTNGDEATYNLKMPIDKAWPSYPVVIEFALIDDEGNAMVCLKVKGQVVDALN